MKILLLGATGRVGSHLLNLSLGAGYHVNALVRNADKIKICDEKLDITQGSVLEDENIRKAMEKAELVISALGTDGGTTLSESMPSIIDAMRQEGVGRIITIGTAGILDSRSEPGKLRYQSSESKRRTTRAAREHHKVYEMLESSGLDWTIVCPTYLPDGEYTGEYRVEQNFLPANGKSISVPDTAEFAFSQIEDDSYVNSRAGITY
ncbi:NAD(P)-dependent oxidoreductase [Salinicoccus carnicancri]|uniref:NAD(P)-dependent oxidoreductase n=1 Tax=Salinicoccus carnicancri TaxID=558170 RepID=UPI0002D2BE63|nr:SDR family oxidoreductase [Salinicoccus carnicancri]